MAEVIKKATRESFGAGLVKLGEKHDDFIVMDADLAAATKSGMFKKAFPERFYNCGIAEQNMVNGPSFLNHAEQHGGGVLSTRKGDHV